MAALRARMDRYLDAEAETPKDRKRFSVLLVYAPEVGLAQEVVGRGKRPERARPASPPCIRRADSSP